MPRDSWSHNGTIPLINDMINNGKSEKEIKAVGYNRPMSENDTAWSPTDKKFGGFWEGGKHWSEVLKDDAIGFIKTAKTKDKPFFMYLAFNAPHDPRQAPQEYLDKYPLENISLPKSWLPMYPYKDSIGNGPAFEGRGIGPFSKNRIRHQKTYSGILRIDHPFG